MHPRPFDITLPHPGTFVTQSDTPEPPTDVISSTYFPLTVLCSYKTPGDGYEILVRQCVVDNGDINSETEIGRIDHCGFVNSIKYNGNNMRGCILACDSDGCNRATENRAFHAVVPLTTAVVSVALRAGYS